MFVNVASGGAEPKFTTNLQVIDDAVQGFWKQLCARSPDKLASLRQVLLDRLLAHADFQLRPMTDEDLLDTLNASNGCVVRDVWTMKQLLKTKLLFGQFLILIHLIKGCGFVSSQHLVGDVSCIPKPDSNGHVSAFRPICFQRRCTGCMLERG